MDKHKIRKLAKSIRNNRTLQSICSINKSIKKNLFSYFDFSRYENILIYLSTPEEVDTWNIIKELKTNNLYVPRIDKIDKTNKTNKTNKMYLTKYTNNFTRNKYGIFECLGKIQNPNIHLAILPLLAFDTTGNRIGYGKGYFDNLLSKTEFQNTILVGLCMDKPYDEWKPESHDIPLHYVITPNKVYNFNIKISI